MARLRLDFFSFLTILVLVLSPRIANSDTEDHIAPHAGLYEVEVQLDLPHLRGKGASSIAKICLKREAPGGAYGLVVLSANNPLRFCPTINARRDGRDLLFAVKCPGKNMAVGLARFKIFADRFSGRITMKMGGKNMTMEEVQEGRRIGGC